jgi:hypothetical protein
MSGKTFVVLQGEGIHQRVTDLQRPGNTWLLLIFGAKGIASDKQWQVLSKLKNGYQDSLFTSAEVARNVAKPLVLIAIFQL